MINFCNSLVPKLRRELDELEKRENGENRSLFHGFDVDMHPRHGSPLIVCEFRRSPESRSNPSMPSLVEYSFDSRKLSRLADVSSNFSTMRPREPSSKSNDNSLIPGRLLISNILHVSISLSPFRWQYRSAISRWPFPRGIFRRYYSRLIASRIIVQSFVLLFREQITSLSINSSDLRTRTSGSAPIHSPSNMSTAFPQMCNTLSTY